MSIGDLITKEKYNNVAAKLRTARDKYYGGYQITGDVENGTMLTAKHMNTLAIQLLDVTNKSPLKFTYPISVTVGEIIKNTLSDNLNIALVNITSVANCYSNCHSNCHSNCQSSSGCGNSR